MSLCWVLHTDAVTSCVAFGVCLHCVSIHAVVCQYCTPLSGWTVVRYIDIPHWVYSVTRRWPLRWFLLFGYYYDDVNICVDIFSLLLCIYLGVELLGLMVTLCLTFWGTATLFSKVQRWLHHFTFPPAMYGGSDFPASSPVCCLSLSYSCPGGCELVSHGGFDMYLPNA